METIGSPNAPRGTIYLWIKRNKSVRGTKNRRSQRTHFKKIIPKITHQGKNQRL